MMRLACVSALALFAIGSGTAAAEDEPAPLRLARYTTAAALPDPALTTPLAIVAQVGFPRDTVATVGDALAYLLLRTGYRLGDADAAASALLALPLPEAHRQLGPYPVRAIAALLVGSAYELRISEVDRRLDVALAAPVQKTNVDEPAHAADALDAAPTPVAALTQPHPEELLTVPPPTTAQSEAPQASPAAAAAPSPEPLP
ncbi:MAG: hypothetical protein KDH20_16395 [Rhodocyclaceae bacterium]|nr:hypothetical protein [Rhodocyclaceae bacterium]